MDSIEILIIILFIAIFLVNIFLTKKDFYWKYFNYILIILTSYILIDGYLSYLKDLKYIYQNNIEDKFIGFGLLALIYLSLIINIIILIINTFRYFYLKYFKNKKLSK